MRKITLLLFLLLPACCLFQNSPIFAQQYADLNHQNPAVPASTNIIFSVDPKNNGVNEVFIREPDIEAQLYKLKGECYRCEFYSGSIEGPFTTKDSRIRPGKKATLTIHTMQNLMPGKVFDPGPYPPGSRFGLGRTKATVIENQKGTFKLRIP
ncbi:hypothetical protein FK178_13255 [Antarcticibacterium arcticum]|uniref:Uncharacterized protein n=1 Tax=Antarcticibacterium arcticum TaxID=2585771 RepID=A0A5B8YM88_9FLAO|nr:hypothetical protein [Antarcticibacterium arcticum]QED38621.1 hypothetical protein FK178_13255 [Antarcticibacterium arcticum]